MHSGYEKWIFHRRVMKSVSEILINELSFIPTRPFLRRRRSVKSPLFMGLPGSYAAPGKGGSSYRGIRETFRHTSSPQTLDIAGLFFLICDTSQISY